MDMSANEIVRSRTATGGKRTWVMTMPVLLRNSSPARWCGELTPDEP